MKFIDNESKDDKEMLLTILSGLGGVILMYMFILICELFR